MSDMRSPLERARDNWLYSENGKDCCEGTASGVFLKHRLCVAFLDGAQMWGDYPLMEKMQKGLWKRIEKHGDRPFASHMEGLGVVCEEYHEFVEACRSNDQEQIEKEAMDLAVAALWMLVKRGSREDAKVAKGRENEAG